MARAMTAVKQACPPVGEEERRADQVVNRGGTMNMPQLVAKNLLFWGSISLSIYGLYAVVAAL